jgi:hypothetical protein
MVYVSLLSNSNSICFDCSEISIIESCSKVGSNQVNENIGDKYLYFFNENYYLVYDL